MTEKNYLALFAKSFNWAGFFLPKNIYRDCSKLYAFCRVLDDLVDEKTNLELRTERFNKIQDFIQRSYEQNDNNRTLEDWHEHGSIINEMIVNFPSLNYPSILLYHLIQKLNIHNERSIEIILGLSPSEGICSLDFETQIDPLPFIQKLNDHDTSCIIYTSGTTSDPKGVKHTTKSLFTNGKLFVDNQNNSIQNGDGVAKVRSWSFTINTAVLETVSLGDFDRTIIPGMTSTTGSASIYYYAESTSSGHNSNRLSTFMHSKSSFFSTTEVLPYWVL